MSKIAEKTLYSSNVDVNALGFKGGGGDKGLQAQTAEMFSFPRARRRMRAGTAATRWPTTLEKGTKPGELAATSESSVPPPVRCGVPCDKGGGQARKNFAAHQDIADGGPRRISLSGDVGVMRHVRTRLQAHSSAFIAKKWVGGD
jgi:hypothetical protein